MFRMTVPSTIDIDALPAMEYKSAELQAEVERRTTEMRAENCTHEDHRPWPEIDNPCQDRENAAVGHEIDAIAWARLMQREANINPSASPKEILESTARTLGLYVYNQSGHVNTMQAFLRHAWKHEHLLDAWYEAELPV